MPPNSTILDGRKTVIDEIIDCYKNKNYSAVVCTALPLIEGLIWEFSYLLNKRGLRIYKNNKMNVLITDNGRELSEFTVGSLLNLSRFKNYIDDYFIRYFCDELYKERNPVLHGREFSSFSEKNASMKMITLEYLLETINRNIENYMMEGLQKKLPEDFKSEIRDMIIKAKKFNQPNAADPKSLAAD